MVTERYKVVQNHEAFAFTDSLLKEGVRYETAGSLQGGKRIWLLAHMPHEYIISGEKFSPYLLFSNTHDGSGAIKVALTPIRVVCQNTLNLALTTAKRSWSMMHTGNIQGKIREASDMYTSLQGYGGIRLLRADEIECRVSTINVYGLRLLLYKNARVDQNILDELFTPFGWQRTHQEIDGKLYCTVSVWDEKREQWISKQDVGTASYSDKEKGQASDSFKRACFNWGIGRELYTAPDIWVPAVRVHIKEKKGHYHTTDHFSVRSISYNERREVSALTVVDQDRKTVFQMGQGQETPQPQDTDPYLGLLYHELERTGIPIGSVLKRYDIQDISQMTLDIYNKALIGLMKTKTKGAA